MGRRWSFLGGSVGFMCKCLILLGRFVGLIGYTVGTCTRAMTPKSKILGAFRLAGSTLRT